MRTYWTISQTNQHKVHARHIILYLYQRKISYKEGPRHFNNRHVMACHTEHVFYRQITYWDIFVPSRKRQKEKLIGGLSTAMEIASEKPHESRRSEKSAENVSNNGREIRISPSGEKKNVRVRLVKGTSESRRNKNRKK